jgi:hypothetical protein
MQLGNSIREKIEPSSIARCIVQFLKLISHEEKKGDIKFYLRKINSVELVLPELVASENIPYECASRMLENDPCV